MKPNSAPVLPHSLEAEVCVLGSMMLEPGAIDKARALIGPEDFFRPGHQLLFSALTEMHEAGQPVDLVTLSEALKAKKLLGRVGGVEYLDDIVQGVPSALHVETYGRIVGEKARLRKLIALCEKGCDRAYADAGGADDLLAEFAGQAAGLSAGPAALGPVLTCFADIEPVAVNWLWPGRVPLGRITLLVGRPGVGKSFLTTDMAARVSTGTPWPDGTDCPAGSAIIISVEDDPGDTIRPRLDAHRADPRKVHLLSGVRRATGGGGRHERLFTLGDLPSLEAALKAHPDCRLVVVDPVGSFLGGDTDAHRDNEVRSVLAPVAMLAAQYGPAVLVVAHRRKSGGTAADDLALGSRAFTGIARAVWHLTREKDNPGRRLLLAGKNNLAPEGDGLAFTIMGQPPALAWQTDPVQMSADDALALENGAGEGHRPGPDPEVRGQAAEWLRELLQGGPMESAKIKEEAEGAGYAWRTVHRAKDALGVKPYKQRFGGGWLWRLPADAGSQDQSCHVPQVQGNLASWHDSGNQRKSSGSYVPQLLSCQPADHGKIGPAEGGKP